MRRRRKECILKIISENPGIDGVSLHRILREEYGFRLPDHPSSVANYIQRNLRPLVKSGRKNRRRVFWLDLDLDLEEVF